MLILVIGIVCLIVAIVCLIRMIPMMMGAEVKPKIIIIGIISLVVGMVIVLSASGSSGSHYEDTYTNSPQYYEDGYNYYHNNPDAWARDFGN